MDEARLGPKEFSRARIDATDHAENGDWTACIDALQPFTRNADLNIQSRARIATAWWMGVALRHSHLHTRVGKPADEDWRLTVYKICTAELQHQMPNGWSSANLSLCIDAFTILGDLLHTDCQHFAINPRRCVRFFEVAALLACYAAQCQEARGGTDAARFYEQAQELATSADLAKQNIRGEVFSGQSTASQELVPYLRTLNRIATSVFDEMRPLVSADHPRTWRNALRDSSAYERRVAALRDVPSGAERAL